MGLLDRFFPPPKRKGVNSGIFSFLLGHSAPDMKGSEFQAAYKGWVYACVNPIASEFVNVGLFGVRQSLRSQRIGAHLVRIYELVWNEDNEEHVARHGVDRDEVDEVPSNRPFITRGRGGTYRVIGQSDGGRILMVVVAPRGGGRFYVVTARDADADERRAYRRR